MTRAERFLDRVAWIVLVLAGGFVTLVALGWMTSGMPPRSAAYWEMQLCLVVLSTVAGLWLTTHKQGEGKQDRLTFGPGED